MVEKITALIFGLLALALEVWQSIVNPTVESIVAAAFAAIIVISMIVLLKREKVITLIEDLPRDNRPNSRGMKFVNEIVPHIKEKDGKLILKILKK